MLAIFIKTFINNFRKIFRKNMDTFKELLTMSTLMITPTMFGTVPTLMVIDNMLSIVFLDARQITQQLVSLEME